MPPLAPFEADLKTSQYEMDPERYLHSPELYAIWASKSWMLAEEAQKMFSRRTTSSGWILELGGKVDVKRSNQDWQFLQTKKHTTMVHHLLVKDDNMIYRTWPDTERVHKIFSSTCASPSGSCILLSSAYKQAVSVPQTNPSAILITSLITANTTL